MENLPTRLDWEDTQQARYWTFGSTKGVCIARAVAYDKGIARLMRYLAAQDAGYRPGITPLVLTLDQGVEPSLSEPSLAPAPVLNPPSPTNDDPSLHIVEASPLVLPLPLPPASAAPAAPAPPAASPPRNFAFSAARPGTGARLSQQCLTVPPATPATPFLLQQRSQLPDPAKAPPPPASNLTHTPSLEECADLLSLGERYMRWLVLSSGCFPLEYFDPRGPAPARTDPPISPKAEQTRDSMLSHAQHLYKRYFLRVSVVDAAPLGDIIRATLLLAAKAVGVRIHASPQFGVGPAFMATMVPVVDEQAAEACKCSGGKQFDFAAFPKRPLDFADIPLVIHWETEVIRALEARISVRPFEPIVRAYKDTLAPGLGRGFGVSLQALEGAVTRYNRIFMHSDAPLLVGPQTLALLVLGESLGAAGAAGSRLDVYKQLLTTLSPQIGDTTRLASELVHRLATMVEPHANGAPYAVIPFPLSLRLHGAPVRCTLDQALELVGLSWAVKNPAAQPGSESYANGLGDLQDSDDELFNDNMRGGRLREAKAGAARPTPERSKYDKMFLGL